MDGVAPLREDLAFVDRMIAECQHHIARLQESTVEMPSDRQNTDLANDVLACFTAALARYSAERERVVSAMQGGKPIAGLDRSRSPQANIRRRKEPRRAKRSGSRAAAQIVR